MFFIYPELTFCCRFSGLVGALGGGLSTLSGYNGLPSVLSGLDDSMSDVAARKKYPFELEKAIHNVMFIQHHMQRQDEFNAVSLSPSPCHCPLTQNLQLLIEFLIENSVCRMEEVVTTTTTETTTTMTTTTTPPLTMMMATVTAKAA